MSGFVTCWSLVFVMAFCVGTDCPAATYHVSPAGDNEADGSISTPWRTISRSADAANAGDTVVVHAGNYDERVTTVRGGSGPEGRIRFVAEDGVIMKGWRVHHPFTTLEGFHITGHTDASVLEGYVRTNSGGDNLELIDCVFRDAPKLLAGDVAFVAPNLIDVPSGGLLAGGFAVGQVLDVNRGSETALLNTASYLITEVTDTRLTVGGATIVNQGPVAAFLSPAAPYGLVLNSGTQNCLVRGCVFRNLAYDSLFILGTGHLLEDNLVEQSNGWDGLHFGGANHVFRNNVFRNSPLAAYQVSPDAWENYSPEPYLNVLFTHNVVQGFAGVMASQKGANTSSGLHITRNVFIDVGRFSLTHPGTVIDQNTFLRVARQSFPVVSRSAHPILANTSVGATNTVIRNNVFLECGEPNGTTQTESNVGWYEVSGSSATVTGEGNFVAGGAPGFGPKTGWPEGLPILNGGDPGLANLTSPFGEDGLPFTDDDGLRPRPDSKLIGRGISGLTPGAYGPVADDEPSLWLEFLTGGQVKLSWPETDEVWTLQRTESLGTGWAPVVPAPVLQAGSWSAVPEPLGPRAFFRLVR